MRFFYYPAEAELAVRIFTLAYIYIFVKCEEKKCWEK